MADFRFDCNTVDRGLALLSVCEFDLNWNETGDRRNGMVEKSLARLSEGTSGY